METASPRLQVIDLVKTYRKSGVDVVRAVQGISFEIASGECFGLLGPNGAGKSTAIQCISGFYPPTSGKVLIEGINVHTEPKRARQALGVCQQDDTLDTDFKVLDQLARHATYYRIPSGDARNRAEELLQRFNLSDKAKDPVEALSGGMRRRLQVARALISRPTVVILDEPTTGLDPEARRSLWEILGQLRREGVAVLLSTHYMEEAERLCDRIAILHQGLILDIASPAELIRRHLNAAEVTEEIRPGVRWTRPPNLEDVYLKLTGAKLGEAQFG